MRIAFYKSFITTNIWDWIVGILTFSKYSHCELIVDDYAYSSSNRDDGVRRKQIVFNPKNWDIYEINAPEDKWHLFKFYITTKDLKYDLIPVLLYPFIDMIKTQNHHKYFCSEWIAKALNRMKITKMLNTAITPGELYTYLLKLKVIKN